ncbi:MAG TPA: flagellar hook capping FlgD N-terminal domain-containing protein [Solirubrobacteraceae bacterium]|jgi:flagellar basal-body rod modification protein FlgD|nr:flagellar hook capping FlgD N-terminal domain-containing protein [Solirubrobacteraceae bacterium]
MSTTGINGSSTLSTSGSTLTPSTQNSADSTSGLGENDFLQLMMDQLQNQNPLSPDDPTQYLSELAQFSSLETETNIASNTSTANNQGSAATALALLGHTVDYTDSNGQSASGTVSKIDFTSTTGPTLTIGSETGIALSSVTDAS